MFDYVKLLIHISSFLFPKFPSYYFTCFMFLKYIKIQLQQKSFKIVSYPDDFIKSLLSEIKVEGAVDVSNCVFVKSSFVRDFAKLYSIRDLGSKPRFVQIFTTNYNGINIDEVIVSSNLNFNLKNVNKLSKSVNIRFIQFFEVKSAHVVDMSQVNVMCDIQSDVIDSILKEYFAIPRLLYRGDIISINLKEYAAHNYFTNKQANSIKTVYFKCNSAVFDNKQIYDCFVCVCDNSTLKLSANVQSFIPEVTKFVVGDNSKLLVDICPYGLRDYYADMKASIKPFLLKSNLKANFKTCIQSLILALFFFFR